MTVPNILLMVTFINIHLYTTCAFLSSVTKWYYKRQTLACGSQNLGLITCQGKKLHQSLTGPPSCLQTEFLKFKVLS